MANLLAQQKHFEDVVRPAAYRKNNLITAEEFVNRLKESAHKVAENNGLSNDDENALLVSVCASIGRR